MLFKDEVRRIGLALGIEESNDFQTPFPGPGLGNTDLGRVTRKKQPSIRQGRWPFYDGWLRQPRALPQSLASRSVLLPVKSVGSHGHKRTYAYTLRTRRARNVCRRHDGRLGTSSVRFFNGCVPSNYGTRTGYQPRCIRYFLQASRNY